MLDCMHVSANIYVCIYGYKSMGLYICMCTRIHVYDSIYTYMLYTYRHESIHECINVGISCSQTHISVCICMCACMSLHMGLYIMYPNFPIVCAVLTLGSQSYSSG